MVTGLEDQPDGSLKVYVGARYRGLYFVTDDAETQKALRVGWAHGGHLLILTPPADVIEAEA